MYFTVDVYEPDTGPFPLTM